MFSFTAPMTRLRRGERGRPARERGQALIEFALVLPFLLILVLGMLDLGKAMHYRNDLTHLANEAARFAAVDKNPGPGLTLEESIRDQATSSELKDGGAPGAEGTTTGPLEVEICFPGAGIAHDIGDPVKVIVRSEYKWLSILGFSATKELVGTSTMRLEKLWTPSSQYGGPSPVGC